MEFLLYGVGIGLAYILWIYYTKSKKNRQCVTDETIEAYRKGKLKEGDPVYEQLIAHLGTCEMCRERMSTF